MKIDLRPGEKTLLTRLLILAVVALHIPTAAAVEPVLDLFGFDLESSEHDLQAWLAREDFQPTTTSMPRAQAFLRESVLTGHGIGYAPAAHGLDMLFLNQRGITIPATEIVSRIEALYGEPLERVPTGRGVRLRYDLHPPSKPGQMVWLVQPGFVGVELTSQSYLASPNAVPDTGPSRWAAMISQWWQPLLYCIGIGAVLFLGFRALPARARSFTGDALGAVLHPVFGALEFLGSRLFALIFGILLIPLFVISGCAAMAGAVEQGTSWLWVIPWIVGVILALESQDSDEFRYVILAELIFVFTFAGVFLQMYLAG